MLFISVKIRNNANTKPLGKSKVNDSRKDGIIPTPDSLPITEPTHVPVGCLGIPWGEFRPPTQWCFGLAGGLLWPMRCGQTAYLPLREAALSEIARFSLHPCPQPSEHQGPGTGWLLSHLGFQTRRHMELSGGQWAAKSYSPATELAECRQRIRAPWRKLLRQWNLPCYQSKN